MQLFDSTENPSPNILKLCDALKTIPPTTVEAERAFSAAGDKRVQIFKDHDELLVTDSGQICHEFESRAIEDPTCRGGRFKLNLSGLKVLPLRSDPRVTSSSPGTIEDSFCRGSHCMLNLSRLKRLSVGVEEKLEEGDARSDVILVTCPHIAL
ncbi:hypothetical protein TNCV_4930071 [Trichonephila clavipes]|nr:hypothetical protein TNCV_4930071 [Trichonephila clavipes]